MNQFITKFFAWLKSMFKKTKVHQKYYFVAGEVVFQVQHPRFETPEETRKNISSAIHTFLATRDLEAKAQSLKIERVEEKPSWRDNLQPPDENTPIITFQIGESEPFSLIPLRVNGHSKGDLSPDSVLNILRNAYQELRADLEVGPMTMDGNINLLSIAPNWISRGLHHGPGTGGPGSLATKTNEGPNGFRFAQASLESLQPFKNRLSGKIHVALLDTIPSDEIKQAARALLQPALRPAGDPALIEYLFEDPGAAGFVNRPHLDVVISRQPQELMQIVRYTQEPGHYQMSNHGTFIAGIVRSIAPRATIHLYQVLNSHGCGSFITIAQGLQDALASQQQEEYALVINCSFMLNLQLGNLNSLMDILGDPATQTLLRKSMRDVFQAATSTPKVIVVAAAGNDSAIGDRQAAKYPAAFQDVLGVGALPKGNPIYPPSRPYPGRYIPASYSNWSFNDVEDNRNRNQAFMVFGGEVNPADGKTKEGVGGVYFGEFFKKISADTYAVDQTISPSEGWAEWSGTSFAAPIITGLLAALAGRENLNLNLVPPNNGPFLTAEGENVIVAQQG